MKHQGTKPIETQRLLLRRFTMEDVDAMYSNWASDPEVTRFLTWPPHRSPEVTERILADWVAQYDREDNYQWAIVLKLAEDRPIGCIGVVSQREDLALAHIGYCLGKPWWHKGIMSEALKAVMDYLFDEVGMERVESRHDPNNPHSGDVMRKCGMRYEGTLRRSDRNNQGICDASWYGLLRAERNS